MFEMFMKEVVDLEHGSHFKLTTTGYMVLAVFLLCMLLIAARTTKSQKISTKQLVFCAMAMAIGFITNNLRLLHMPMGGSITLMSMLFISLIGYWYGPRTGLLTATAYGLLQLVVEPHIYSLPQLFFDYIFAFGALGLSGLFAHSKHGLYKGYAASIIGRFIFAFISGMVFFGAYASDYGMSIPVYSFCYNGAYIFSEAVITYIVIALPPVKDALIRVKNLAEQE